MIYKFLFYVLYIMRCSWSNPLAVSLKNLLKYQGTGKFGKWKLITFAVSSFLKIAVLPYYLNAWIYRTLLFFVVTQSLFPHLAWFRFGAVFLFLVVGSSWLNYQRSLWCNLIGIWFFDIILIQLTGSHKGAWGRS